MRISDWSSDVCSSDLRGPPYARATTVRGHTMHFKPEEIPLITPESGSGGGGCMRSIKAGEMEIGFTWTTGPRDYTPLYAGLPGGVCPCDPRPEEGRVGEGSVSTCRYRWSRCH